MLASLPSRERGLKLNRKDVRAAYVRVAPFTGAWIEIHGAWLHLQRQNVAPFTGAWIEIIGRYAACAGTQSLPSRERGLKYLST